LLPDPRVNAILEDKSGLIWLGTGAGILRFNPSNIEGRMIYNEKNGLKFQDIGYLREDKEGNIWIGSNDLESRVIKYNMQKSRFEEQEYIFSDVDYDSRKIRAMEIDHKNQLWIGTATGILESKIGDETIRIIN
jgi:ligand-binding sensor domain-containing protein